MRIYSVHLRRGGLDPEHDIVLVKEGFSWPAALLSPLWALWRGLWVPAAVMFALIVSLLVMATGLGIGAGATSILLAGFSTGTGYLANDLHRAALDRRDFVLQEIIVARDRDSAERRFFDRNPALAAEAADTILTPSA